MIEQTITTIAIGYFAFLISTFQPFASIRKTVDTLSSAFKMGILPYTFKILDKLTTCPICLAFWLSLTYNYIYYDGYGYIIFAQACLGSFIGMLINKLHYYGE